MGIAFCQWPSAPIKLQHLAVQEYIYWRKAKHWLSTIAFQHGYASRTVKYCRLSLSVFHNVYFTTKYWPGFALRVRLQRYLFVSEICMMMGSLFPRRLGLLVLVRKTSHLFKVSTCHLVCMYPTLQSLQCFKPQHTALMLLNGFYLRCCSLNYWVATYLFVWCPTPECSEFRISQKQQ